MVKGRGASHRGPTILLERASHIPLSLPVLLTPPSQVGFIWRIGCAIFHCTVPSYKMPRPSMNCGVHMVFLIGMLLLETEVGGRKSALAMFDEAVDAKVLLVKAGREGEGEAKGKGLALQDAQGSEHLGHHARQAGVEATSKPRGADVEAGADEVPGGEGEDMDGIPQGADTDFDYDDAYSSPSTFHVSATSAAALGMYPTSSGSMSGRPSAAKRASRSKRASRA